MRNTITIALLFISTLCMGFAGNDIDSIKTALATGDATVIGGKFSSSVQLSLPGSKGLYSKAQATLILKNFFTKNKPSAASVMHKGSSGGGANYVIYKLDTSTGNFRVQIFMKDGSSGKIHEVKIKRS